jgi:hypothetical protein
MTPVSPASQSTRFFLDLRNAPIIDLHPGDIVEVEDAVLIAVHGEAHFSRRGRVVSQRPRYPGIEEMIDHDQEEGCFAGASLGRKGTCTVASFPAFYFDEVDGGATTPCYIGKMHPDPCGFMAKSDEEPPDADVQQCTDDPFGEGQSQHIGQGLRYVSLRSKP